MSPIITPLKNLLKNNPQRKSITLDSYLKIKQLFIDNSKKEFSATKVRDTLNIDYFSVRIALDVLRKEEFLALNGNLWKLIK